MASVATDPQLGAGIERLEELGREREALDALYAELAESMAKLRETARAGRLRPIPPELQDVVMRLVVAVEAERDHARDLWTLALDAFDRRLPQS